MARTPPSNAPSVGAQPVDVQTVSAHTCATQACATQAWDRSDHEAGAAANLTDAGLRSSGDWAEGQRDLSA